MNSGGKNNIQNRLWLTRKRRGLKQKQVAYLLNHRNVDQISRYENGSRTPTLEAALKLEIIFGVPIRLLFTDLHEQLRVEIRERAESNRGLMDTLAHVVGDGACSYSELLSSPIRSSQELEKVRRHATDLVKTMAYL
jgi:transcriptional regulator with XRE-family HTH domain